MKIIEARLYRYALPLLAPLPLAPLSAAHCRPKTRTGLLVALRNDHDAVGWGDIAPLPGFSREDIDQAIQAATDLLSGIPAADSSGLAAMAQQSFPSVAFGIESALYSLRALQLWPGRTGSESVPVNGLLSGSLEEVESGARRLMDAGYRTLKLKVGRNSIEEDLEKVAAVRRWADSSVRLRLDANQAWNLDEAIEFGRAARKYEIEHMEEPLRDSARLEDFYRGCGVAYALDESLRTMNPADVGARLGLAALILKPTLLGGMEKSLQFVRRALELDLVPVLSSSFESSVGLFALADMAAAVAPETACGLGTAAWFAEDLLDFPIPIEQGRMRLGKTPPHAGQIRMELLQEVAFRL